MRKFVSAIIILGVILSGYAQAYTDVSDLELENELELLSKYEIISGYEDGTFRPYNNITRAEFCKLIVCATMNDYIEEYEKAFVDVEDGFWAESYIYAARELGIVNGVTETIFDPQSNITNEQAVKMIVCALGYSNEAIEKGGYPNGYIEVAKGLGIIKNSSFNGKDISTRKGIADMVYNMIDVPLFFIYKSEDGSIERSEAENTLREIHELSIWDSDDNIESDGIEEQDLYFEIDSVG